MVSRCGLFLRKTAVVCPQSVAMVLIILWNGCHRHNDSFNLRSNLPWRREICDNCRWIVALSGLRVHFFSLIFGLGRSVAEVIYMLDLTRLTVDVMAREACHLNTHIVTRHRLHTDDTTLRHGLRIRSFLWAWCIASEGPCVRVLLLCFITISTNPVLHGFWFQITKSGTATVHTVHARVFIKGFVHLKDRGVSVLRARSADHLDNLDVIFITISHMPVWLYFSVIVVCSSGRLYHIVWLECVHDFGLTERFLFIFILRSLICSPGLFLLI